MRDRAIILFPFDKVNKASRVAIYGSGDIAQAYYWELVKTGYADIVAWIDRLWEDGRKLEYPRVHMDRFFQTEFDHVVIGINDRDECLSAKQYLTQNGVEEDRIIIADEVLHFNVRNLVATGEDLTDCADKASVPVSRPIRIGFLATGQMANTMALTIHDQCAGLELYAVASRSIDKAEAFRDKYGFTKAYGSYDELLEDPHVELVYITTPVKFHYEQVMKALGSGKHVICEKPFAVNSRQVEDMIKLAREKNLFLTDGVWSAYLPMTKYVSRIMGNSDVGKVHMISADIHYPSLNDPRLNNLKLCGGQILETGYYVMEFLSLLVETDPVEVNVCGQRLDNSVDFQTNITLKYSNDLMAVIHMGLGSVSSLLGFVYGENGLAVIRDVNQFKHLMILNSLGEVVSEHRHESGYWYEMNACVAAINEGKIETSERPHDLIIRNARLLDEIRSKAGVMYEEDCP